MKFAKTVSETYRYTYIIEAESAEEADQAFEAWSQNESNWEQIANDLSESYCHMEVKDAEPAGPKQVVDIVAKEVLA